MLSADIPNESITASALADFDGPVQVIDVREPFEAELARIDGAVLIPLVNLEHSIDSIRTDVPVVVHCHHDTRSRVAVRMLQRHGFENVRWLAGGIDAWSRDVDPTVPRY